MADTGRDNRPAILHEGADLQLADFPRRTDYSLFRPFYRSMDEALSVAATFMAGVTANVKDSAHVWGSDGRPIRIRGEEWFTPFLRIAAASRPSPDSIFPAGQASDGQILVDRFDAPCCALFRGPNALEPSIAEDSAWVLFGDATTEAVGKKRGFGVLIIAAGVLAAGVIVKTLRKV